MTATEAANSWVTAAQIDAACGMTGYRRVGLLGAMGKSARHRGRTGTWQWNGRDYRMQSKVAALFRKALGDPR
jgi:hypothetical protein